jgi:hypothetical protein
LTSFTATVFRGHFEQGGVPVPGLEQIVVEVVRVVHGREFDPRVKNPDTLEYLLVAHVDRVSVPPRGRAARASRRPVGRS